MAINEAVHGRSRVVDVRLLHTARVSERVPSERLRINITIDRSLALFRRARLSESTHEHPSTTGIVDVDQPIRPVRTGRTIHNCLCDPIGLRPKRTQPRNPSAGQIKDGIAAPAHAMEVVTLDGHWPFRSASTVLPTPFRRPADPR